MTSRPGITRTVGLLVIAGILAITVLYTTFRPAIADLDESHRQRHPLGFSIVTPEGWQVEFQNPQAGHPATIWALPRKSEGIVGGLWAMKYDAKPQIITAGKRALHEGEFQDKPAWVREDTQDDKRWNRTYIFERAGTWYQVVLTRPASDSIMGSAWTAYVNSFSVEAATATRPTPLPTTYPTTQSMPATDSVPLPDL